MKFEVEEKPENQFQLVKTMTEQNKQNHLVTLLVFLTFLAFGQQYMQNLLTFEDKMKFAFFYVYLSLILLFFLILPNPKETGILRVIFKFLYAAATTYLICLIFMCILDRETLRRLLI